MSLERTIRQMMSEAVDPTDTGGAEEASMAMRQLKAIRHFADGIEQRVGQQGDMEEWYQNKLTKAHDYLKTLYSYGKGDPVEEEIEEAVKYPHTMYDPETGKSVEAKSPEDHEKYAKMGYTHDKPEEMEEAKERQISRDEFMKNGGYRSSTQYSTGKGASEKFYTRRPVKEEMDEMKVRGKEVYDKTFANRTQADNYAKKMGGRVQQVGRVFYVFKEEVELEEAKGETSAVAIEVVPDPTHGADQLTSMVTAILNKVNGANRQAKDKKVLSYKRKINGKDHTVFDGLSSSIEQVKKELKKGGVKIVAIGSKTKPSPTPSNSVVMEELEEAYKTPAEAGAYEAGKKAHRAGKKYDDNPNKKGSKEYTAWSKGHNEARAKGMKEDVELEEAKRDPSKSGGSGYDLYHKDFSTAMKHAYDYAKKKFGITIDPKEIDDKVASDPRKPSSGKTNTYRLKGDKGSVQIQVANLDNKKYELNMYKEEVELQESPMVTTSIPNNDFGSARKLEKLAKENDVEYKRLGRTVTLKGKRIDVQTIFSKMAYAGGSQPKMVLVKEEVELDENKNLIKDYQDMKATGKKDSNILDALMSMPKYKRMSKDQMAKIIGDAKRKGIFKEDVELDEKKDEPPFDVSKADYKGAAKELTQYAMTKGGVDKKDFLGFANRMSAIAGKSAPRVTSKFARDLQDLDTDVREVVIRIMRNNGIKVTMAGRGLKIEGVGAELTATQRLRAIMETEVPITESEKPLSSGMSIMEKAIAKIREAEGEKMTDAQMKKREEIVKSMKDKEQEFKDKYGDRWKEVMYATATKMAMGK